ncbi:MAG: nitroreductase [Weeksellaceae bacterium]
MDAKELFQLIRSRRSVMPPLYNEKEISDDEMEMILESANWVPTHKHTEPGRFKILSGNALPRFAEFMVENYKNTVPPEKQNAMKIQKIQEKCLKSNKIILICYRKSGLVPEWEELASVSTAVQNMWLMCTAMGIGSYWSTSGAIAYMHDFIELDAAEKCVGIFYMGKVDAVPYDGHRKPMDEKIKHIDF